MDAVFLSYFHKHFPQMKGYFTDEQLSTLHAFAQHITHQEDGEKIWLMLEEKPTLLHVFGIVVNGLFPSFRRSRKPEYFLLMSLGGLFSCFILVFLLRENLSDTVINMISFTVGIFGTCLKENCSRYFSLLLENQKTP